MVQSNIIPNWLIKRAYLTPNRPAIFFHNYTMTFQQLFDEAKTVAEKLHHVGVQIGDRIGVLLNNHPETIVLLHGLQLLGCETVLLNIRLQDEELLYQLNDSEAIFLISNEKLIEQHNGLKNQWDHPIISIEQLRQEKEKSFPLTEQFTMDDLCTIMYTSGTTGHPKGVMQTYGNHWWSAIGSVINLGLHEGDAWLCAVPLFHISGYSILIRSVLYGIPVILFEKFDEEAINETLISGKATIISVVTAMAQRMLQQLGNRSYHPNFRCMLLGGGGVPLSLLETCKEKEIPVFQTYGMTETASQIATLSPEDSLSKLGSAGKPLFFSQLQIVKEGVQAKPTEIGEIYVKGPNVTRGYWKREDANRESFTVDGWLKTGDMGYMDEEGYLYIVDRRTDLIISGGENIYPAEIEQIILSHPHVKEAAVVGVFDAQWGQIPMAFYVVKEGKNVDEGELIRLCREHLAKYKVPKRWIQLNELPKNASNKVLKRLLRKWVENE
ncbi:o-succinylbenzoate--CoA ligase [Fervidibacillus halotolerans]|uniref:2-succinylbenzoate--CoA ligase n=2 Tax=Fervidibacillus halotolerans TaxID=2980027 RepID=A0A9E8M284_9BACI|nr:o-succinylbenzoate--CoA ligase [Fervidibacillus halotolerans]WAA13954.1 o-succinylbenzoate--CoA ligase [Fervidibacillus halotolerans]